MSETKTPVEVAAEALWERDSPAPELGWPHWDVAVERAANGLWDLPQMVADTRTMARTVFASVDVDGLAEVLRAHRLERWEVGDPDTSGLLTLVCTCRLEYVMEEHDGAEEQLETVHEGHQAEAVKAWMSGGGA